MGGCIADLCQCCKVFAPAILATCGFILGAVANFVCESVTFPIQGLDLYDGEGLTIYAGPWSYRTVAAADFNNETYIFNICVGYGNLQDIGFDYYIDSTTKVVMAFSIITVIIGAIGIVFAYMLPCTSNPRSSMWTAMGGIFMATCLFQGLTMLIARSSICWDNPLLQYITTLSPSDGEFLPEKCELDRGFKLNIAATWLWGVAGAFAILVKPPNEGLLTPLTAPAALTTPAGGDGDGKEEGDADPENAADEKKAVAATAAAAAATPDAEKEEEGKETPETAPPAEETKEPAAAGKAAEPETPPAAEEPAPAEKPAETEAPPAEENKEPAPAEKPAAEAESPPPAAAEENKEQPEKVEETDQASVAVSEEEEA